MLTPSEIREKTYKNGLGYDKKDVDQFILEVAGDFEQLLSENDTLKKDIKALTDSISYYKSIEKTLQKALVIAERTAQDIKDNAHKEAEATRLDARANARLIEAQAMKQSEMLEHKTLNLLKQYDLFKAHYRNLLNAQLELLNSSSFSINTMDFSYSENPLSQPKLTGSENGPDDKVIKDESQSENNNLKNNNDTTLQNEDAFEFIAIDDEAL